MILITLNGEKVGVSPGTTLGQLLESMHEPHAPDKIVEVNRQFIHSKNYAGCILRENDVVEVIYLCFGG